MPVSLSKHHLLLAGGCSECATGLTAERQRRLVNTKQAAWYHLLSLHAAGTGLAYHAVRRPNLGHLWYAPRKFAFGC